MPAAKRGEKGDSSRNADLVSIDRSSAQHNATPVYAQRDDEGTGVFDIEVDVRGWSAQALQWLIIFTVLGLLIGGAKWWNARQDAAIARLVSAPPPITTPAQPNGGDDPDGTAIDGTTADGTAADAGSYAGTPAATHGPSVADPPFPQSPDGSTPGSTGDDLVAASSPGSAAGTIDVPTVRAPADVPYPRRIHDVTPQVPDGAAVRRGIAVLTLLIDTAGNVAEVELLRGLDPALDEAAIAAAWQWKFEPTRRNGRPVAVRSNFTVRFGY